MAYKVGYPTVPFQNVAARTVTAAEGAQTTVTVASGLDAGVECYILFWRIKLGASATTQFRLQVNAGTSNLKSVQLAVANADEYTTNDTTHFRLVEIVYNAAQDNFANGMLLFIPHKSVEGVSFERGGVGVAKSTWTGATYPSFYGSGGEFENTADDIASIEVSASQANGIGVGSQFWLCKVDFDA